MSTFLKKVWRVFWIILLIIFTLPIAIIFLFIITEWVNSYIKNTEMNKSIKSWQNISLLNKERGQFYAFNYDYDPQNKIESWQNVYLYEFDLKENHWEKHYYPAFRQICSQDGCNKNSLHSRWDIKNHYFIGSKSPLNDSDTILNEFLFINLKSRQEEILSFMADRAFLSPAAEKVLFLKCTPGYLVADHAKGFCKAKTYDREAKIASDELPIKFDERYAYEGVVDWEKSGNKILYRNAEGLIEIFDFDGQRKHAYIEGKEPKWGKDDQGFFFEPPDNCGLNYYSPEAERFTTVLTAKQTCGEKVYLFDNYLTASGENAVGWTCLGSGAPRSCNFFGVVMVNLQNPSQKTILKEFDNQYSFYAVWNDNE